MPEKEFNISIQTIELIESSDDELNNSDENWRTTTNKIKITL
jgi:hypothetical protein